MRDYSSEANYGAEAVNYKACSGRVGNKENG